MLNKQKGNMYDFINFTWNTVKGKCPHSCSYCYCKQWGEQKPIRFDEKELKTELGSDNFIFVGSSCDMWAQDIPEKWIDETLGHCEMFDNNYLFQSKNPERFNKYKSAFPVGTTLATTIETNRVYPEMGKTPRPIDRMMCLSLTGLKTMVTIEPIMDFDLDEMVSMLEFTCNLQQINIGSDSGNNNLPEPEPEKIRDLISALQEFTDVKLKKNLKRLLP